MQTKPLPATLPRSASELTKSAVAAPEQGARPRGQADWSREHCPPFSWQPSRQLLQVLRAYTRAKQRGDLLSLAYSKLLVLRHRFWSVVTGADIPLNTRHIEGGLLMPHPSGVVIHPDVRIGPNCCIAQQVTLGTGSRPGVPRLGSHVDIGAGAKILGGVTIGDHAVVGANAVVLEDVPPFALAVGVPATIRPRLEA
jgi:serine O-acetyltransferase